LAARNGVPVHLDVEVARSEYEQLIRPLLEGTLDSVHRALSDAGKRPDQVEEILLVGGATRTPLITSLLQDATGLTPRQELHPDLCVAFGAGVLAARLAGHAVERVLVDISPYSFGPSYFGLLNGVPSEHCYRPIISRNTPLPVSRTESYFTMVDEQQAWQVSIYQGDDPHALNNLLVGRFLAEGFSRVPAGNEILCRMDLDLDGILQTPSNLVVALWPSEVESTAPLDFLLRHGLWTPFGCPISCKIRSIISATCGFTTKSDGI